MEEGEEVEPGEIKSRAKEDPSVLVSLLRQATGHGEPGDTTHLELKPVAPTTVQEKVIREAARSHPAVRYLLNAYWLAVTRQCARFSQESTLPTVRLTPQQMRTAEARGLCASVVQESLPPASDAFHEFVRLWLVLDKTPGLGRLILHPRALNEYAPLPESFRFPSPFQIVRDVLGRTPAPARVVDARAYYWQFRAPPALRDALRFYYGGRLFTWQRLPMGLRHAVAAGQGFFLWMTGLPQNVDWGVPQSALVYIDGSLFVGLGSDATFRVRVQRGPVVLGEDGEWGYFPEYCGLAFNIIRGQWGLKQSFLNKVLHDPAVTTGRAVLSVLGRIMAALRYLALPFALAPSVYRYASDLLRDTARDLDKVLPWDGNVVQEVERCRGLVGFQRVWRPLPVETMALASDASLRGWGVVVVRAGIARAYVARWPTVQTSMPVCECAALVNGMLIAVHLARQTYLEMWGDCVPALTWVRRGLARSPLVNSWIARAVMTCECAGVALGLRWMSTLVMPADTPSRDGVPDGRTLAWRPVPRLPTDALRGPEWPLGLAGFAEPVEAHPVLQVIMPGWQPPPLAPTVREGFHEEFPAVWVDPAVMGLTPRPPEHARIVRWSLGHSDLRVVFESGAGGWKPPEVALRGPVMQPFSGSEPVVVDGEVVPPPVGWGEGELQGDPEGDIGMASEW